MAGRRQASNSAAMIRNASRGSPASSAPPGPIDQKDVVALPQLPAARSGLARARNDDHGYCGEPTPRASREGAKHDPDSPHHHPCSTTEVINPPPQDAN